MPILPDVLQPGLRVVFCGTGAGTYSARAGAYYANPGNKFWPTLHAIGLTPHRIAPADFRQVLDHGIGLTDVAKEHVGQDTVIDLALVDAGALGAKIALHRPAILAFTSKRAASLYLDHPTAAIPYGPQDVSIGPTRIHVLTSPSGQAGPHWSIEPWRDLARALSG
ncbi:mismatch-specific DNA-glycosylase [Kaistia adipata]|uniref:mismatch-specific DNA-glycosylase n=1 Tax=Kaistia adipata TaxID=166954 RepID=UPI00041B8177|nr:mismatch-specific DNA-glycosylase [Kaistia adipata]